MEATMRPANLTSEQLARLWRRHVVTLRNARTAAGVLVADEGEGTGRAPFRYYYTTIDRIHQLALAAQPVNRSRPLSHIPTVRELMDYTWEKGRPALMTTSEVMTYLRLPKQTIHDLVATGVIVGFQPLGSGLWLFPATLINEYKRKHGLPDNVPLRGLTREYVTMLTGLSAWSIAAYSSGDAPMFQPTRDARHRNKRVVTHKSVLDYIGRQLARDPDGISHFSRSQWCIMRSTHRDELLSLERAARARYTSTGRVMAAINQGVLPCLWTPGGAARIPKHAVEAWQLAS